MDRFSKSGKRPAFSAALRKKSIVCSSISAEVARGSITLSHVLPDFFKRNSFKAAPTYS